MLTRDMAGQFARIALSHVSREYPNKLDHVLLSSLDVRSPRELHPVFFGSFDWHSCVHGYWLLARVLRRFPDIEEADEITRLFYDRLTIENVNAEKLYAENDARRGFERPYGWAWLLMFAAEVEKLQDADGNRWSGLMRPLAGVFAGRFVEFLPIATYPIRVGTHFNTAFAVSLALEYATSRPVGVDSAEREHRSALQSLLTERCPALVHR